MKRIIASVIPALIGLGFLILFFANPTDWKYREAFLTISFIFITVAAVAFTIMFYDKKSKKIKWLENRLEAWNSISYHVTQAGDEAFNELPIGILVYDDEFVIKWSNKNLKNIFQNRLVDSSLNDLSVDIVMNIRSKKDRFIYFYDGKYFEIISNYENKVLYFFDETSREELQLKYNNRTSAIAIISIDNLEESLKRYDMQEQSNIKGQILGEIADYASEHMAYLQSYNDRLVLLLDRESLNNMIKDKFDILNDIRDVASKNHLKTSISIGVACYDVEYDELGSLAQSALELAEKRGGDQVVVNIQNEKIQYFGGKANALEKNTLVNARLHSQAIKEAIVSATNVIVMTHRMADCDAFASLISISKLVIACEKDVKVLYEDSLVDSTVKKLYNYLDEVDPDVLKCLAEPKNVDIKSNSLLIIVDTQSPAIAMYPKMIEEFKNIIVIDHHRHGENGFNEPIVNYVEPYASSTIELISELFMFFGENVSVSPALATISLAGLVVDTNNFTYRTGVRTFEAASVLKDYDGDMAIVRSLLRDSFETERILSEAVASSEVLFGRFAIARISDDNILKERTLLAKISDRLLNIDGVEASFSIGCVEEAGFVGISARSLDQINVQLIMEELGGGGHLNAAACQYKDTTVESLYLRLLELLKRDFDNGVGNMKVILLKDVDGRGKKNQIIDVANGYGNYLLNNNLALTATNENVKAIEEQQIKANLDALEHKKLMEHLKGEIEAKSINLYIKIGNDGKPFGHITTKQICDEFEAQTGIKLDKRKVELPSEINSVGIYTATVLLHKEVTASIEINVLEK